LAIVNTAREYRDRKGRNADCSHLVHEIYGRAGFAYPYANSFKLYAGVESFRRVKTPQAGDLIVWRGHVGIVVNPVQHSFYSSHDSGPGIDFYDSRYWLGRGPARLYRYTPAGSESMGVMAVGARPETPEGAIPVIVIEQDDEATLSAAQPLDRGVPHAARTRETPRIPASVAINLRGAQPTSGEIEEAISELCNTAEDVLRRGDSLKPPLPVTVFSRLRVERLRVKGEVGWAQVRIDSIASIDGERISLKSHRRKCSWKLRHTESGWLVFTPLDRIYVPRQVAARVFAEELARMTRSSVADSQGGTLIRQEARLTGLLGALFRDD
jgi:hypothetical protein